MWKTVTKTFKIHPKLFTLLRTSFIFVCGQRPKDQVITWVVLVVLDTSLIYFWGAILSYTSGLLFWFKTSRRPRTIPGPVQNLKRSNYLKLRRASFKKLAISPTTTIWATPPSLSPFQKCIKLHTMSLSLQPVGPILRTNSDDLQAESNRITIARSDSSLVKGDEGSNRLGYFP